MMGNSRIVRLLVSLELTVACLALALVLVFAGTIAQVHEGLFSAQARYFRSFAVWWGPPGAGWSIPIFPGGYLVGGVLLINLIASHLYRFGLDRRKVGNLAIHGGLILLLIGQLATDLLSVETSMRLTEGETKSYSESQRQIELVVVDTTSPDRDTAVSVSERRLGRGRELALPNLPLKARVVDYYANSVVSNRVASAGAPASSPATQGLGLQLAAAPQPETVRTDQRNLPSGFVELRDAGGGVVGTWLVSAWLDQLQPFSHQGRSYAIGLRFARDYKPFSLTLLAFRHDKYKGTEIPKNFSSRVRLRRADTGEDREVLIYMNNPLRYAGETFYQSGYDEKDPRVTILQVVRNPGWLTPYLACVMVGGGLVLQFAQHLWEFIRDRKHGTAKATAPAPATASRRSPQLARRA